jgi:glycosyltransferase involved in cell wall biosynthesis
MKKSNSLLISVIMNCHNGKTYLKHSITSLLNQKYKNWELIFWDNNSSDNSSNILLSFNDKRIKYFRSKKFNSLYKSRNLAIKESSGKFISFLDVDDWWDANKLKEQVDLIKKRKNVNFLYSNFYNFNQFNKTKKIAYKYKLPTGNITQKLLNEYKIGILTVMINKKFFKNKKFNEKYNIIGDFDFFINLSLKENIFCIQKPLAYYRIHNKNLSRKFEVIYNELKIWIKKNEKKFKTNKYNLFLLKTLLLRMNFKRIYSYVFQS